MLFSNRLGDVALYAAEKVLDRSRYQSKRAAIFTAKEQGHRGFVSSEALEARVLLTNYALNSIASFSPFTKGNAPRAPLVSDAQGNLYGTTSSGGANNAGTIFKIASGTSSFSIIASFGVPNSTPSGPATITVDSHGNLYGTSFVANNGGQETIFEVPSGSTSIIPLATVASLSDGFARPLTIDALGNIFGVTNSGGLNNDGFVYEIAAGSSSVTTLAPFTPAIGEIESRLTLDAGGNLYGIGESGGSLGDGAILELASGSSVVTVAASFNGTNGSMADAGLVADTSGNLYGTTSQGGASNDGTIFELSAGSSSITLLASFSFSNSGYSIGSLARDSAGDLYGVTQFSGASNVGTIFELASSSSTVTILSSFNGANGAYPDGGVLLNAAGSLFGTSEGGGFENDGSIFRLASGSSVITSLYSFSTTQGDDPGGGVTLDASGNLYGTTTRGGVSYNYGTVFEIPTGSSSIATVKTFTTAENPNFPLTPDLTGNLDGVSYFGGAYQFGDIFKIKAGSTSVSTLVSFSAATVTRPEGPVIFDSRGNLYGTAGSGGVNGTGAIFEINPGSTSINILASFPLANGYSPFPNGITLDSNGNLYGTTQRGGANNDGTIFELASGSSTIITLASFNGADGSGPAQNLLCDAAGNLLGTATSGGTYGDGTFFKLTVGTSSISVLSNFDGTNGNVPTSGLTLDASENLFGVTSQGGAYSDGTVYEIASGSSSITTLLSFNGKNGSGPAGNLTIDASGDLYGATAAGGVFNAGTVFELIANTQSTLSLTSPVGGSTASVMPTFSGNAMMASGNSSMITLSLYSGSSAGTTSIQTLTTTANSVTGAFSVTVPSALTGGTYTVQANQSLSDGTTAYSAPATFTVDPTLADVRSFTIDDGTAQRSNIRTLTVVFTVPVALDQNAIELTQTSGSNTLLMPLNRIGTYPASQTIFKFTAGTSSGTSLADGNYSLIIRSADVHPISNPSANMIGPDRTYTFFRLFGDSNGDGTVNLIDYRAFAASYLKSSGSAGYNFAFDTNNDGTINLVDYRAFTANYLKTITT